ncbi:MAG: type IX secretion system membrane protein PorP/SprF [Bacteroidales bacterium]|jgi:type IX secretion system PorP/SprF family membrane protein|nr:type IX secretion system membrane protein PorP/SprF [Bacteroidales bacterium]
MTRYKYTLIIFLAFSSFIGISQESDQKIGQPYEPVYSQYWVNGLAINPAYTGSRECFSNTLLYRNQWMGFEGAPVTQTLSSHAPLKDGKNAVGVFLFHEEIGVTDYIDIYGNYAFRFKLGKGKLSLGLRAGATLFQGNYADISSDPEGLTTDLVLDDESAVLPNVGVGVYYYSDKYFIGLSVPKLLSHELKNSQKNMSISPDNYDFLLTAGYLLKINEIVKVKPSFLFRYRLDNTFQLDVGGNVIFYDALWIGGSYRIDDEIVAMLEYQVSNQIRAGVAYDFATGDFAGHHSGSLEIVLRYEFKYKIRAVSPRYF